jgi:hypothetical protein
MKVARSGIKHVHFDPSFEAEDEERSCRRRIRQEEKEVGKLRLSERNQSAAKSSRDGDNLCCSCCIVTFLILVGTDSAVVAGGAAFCDEE